MQNRKYTRVQYQNDIEVQYKGLVKKTTSRNLSLRGIRLLKPEGLSVPEESSVILSFTDHQKTAEIQGRLNYSDETEWGVVFTHIGENSLKNLIQSMEQASEKGENRKAIQQEIRQMVLRVAE